MRSILWSPMRHDSSLGRMPMSPADTERKIQQLDGDVQSIYEMLGAIDGTLRRQHNRLEEIAADLSKLDAKIDGVHDSLGTRIDGLDAKIDKVLDLLGTTRSD